ncbi:hypothetical protein [Pedococcus sp.]|jgi:hypothetical protein|uniref:hypothetical protein n=1 Tax=Pedococcus sp. TaxID=2860345 RepID=UPI002E160664|nr:hypothetical protein [Pedococcus sp.]
MSTQLALTTAAAAVLLLAQSTPSTVVPADSHAHTVSARPAQGARCPSEAMMRPGDRMTPWRRTPFMATAWGPLSRPAGCALLVTRARARALERDPLR